jgi:hypothetical protein
MLRVRELFHELLHVQPSVAVVVGWFSQDSLFIQFSRSLWSNSIANEAARRLPTGI